jgi:hypothetical protein
MAAAGGGGAVDLAALRLRVIAAGGPAAATLQPDKVERLTLSLFLFRAWIKDELKRAEIEALLDNEELAEEYDDTVDDSPPEDDDAAA